MRLAPLVSEILVPELQPRPEDFMASAKLADAMEKRAALLERGMVTYNRQRGVIPPELRKEFTAVSRTVEEAFESMAGMAGKLLVPNDQEAFRGVAAPIVNAVMREVALAQDKSREAEYILLGSGPKRDKYFTPL